MIHLALQTEYTFQKCYGHLKQIVNQAKQRDDWALGISVYFRYGSQQDEQVEDLTISGYSFGALFSVTYN